MKHSRDTRERERERGFFESSQGTGGETLMKIKRVNYLTRRIEARMEGGHSLLLHDQFIFNNNRHQRRENEPHHVVLILQRGKGK